MSSYSAPKRATGGLNSTALALIPLAIAINIAMGQLVSILRLPLYLDSIGTVLVGVLLGPWLGALTGALTNVIWGLTLAPVALPFFYVAAVIGLMAGFASRWGFFLRPSPRWLSALVGAIFLFALTLFVTLFFNSTWNEEFGFLELPNAADLIGQNPIIFIVALIAGAAAGYYLLERAGYAGIAGLLTGIVAAIISAPTVAVVFGGVTGSGTDLLIAAFRSSGAGILASAFAQGTVSDPFDKLMSFLVVWLIVQALPQRLLRRFPNLWERNELDRPVGRPATSR